MSAGKGGKRISVFDRLGPGTDEPSGSAHRRYSTDKGGHVEKGRHGHARGDEPLRERKPSHTEYEEKKYLHYRGDPAPPQPTRGRQHRQYQASESDHSGEEAGGGKKGTPRVKPREGPPEGALKDGYYKHHVLHEERGGKVVRGGGVRVKRGSSESDSLSDGESGGEEGKRKRLHRTEQERRPKPHSSSMEGGGLPSRPRPRSSSMEGGGLPSRAKPHSSSMEGGGLPSRAKPHSSSMEGSGLPSRAKPHSSSMEGSGLPSRPKPHSSSMEGGGLPSRPKPHSSSMEGGGLPSRPKPHSSSMEGSGLPSRPKPHSSSMEGSGLPSRAKPHSSSIEGSGLPSRAKPHSSSMEGGGLPSRPKPHSSSMEGSGLPSRPKPRSSSIEGSGLPSRAKPHSSSIEGSGLPSRPKPHSSSMEGSGTPEDGRRLSKHLERKEKLPERHTYLERSGGLPSNMEPKFMRVKPPELKEEREGVYHKRRREEDHPEARHLPPDRERKRKYEAIDIVGLPEAKRPRLSEQYPPLKDIERQRFKEGEERYRVREFDLGDRKRKYEGREPLPRKRTRSHTPEGLGGRRRSKPISPSLWKESTEQRRGREREHKSDDSVSETDSTAEGSGIATKKLDWSSLCALSSAKPPPAKTSALERFTPGSLFSRIGVSPSLAGEHLFKKISGLVSRHLKKSQQHLDPQNVNILPESFIENPFNGIEFGSSGAFQIKERQSQTQIFSDIGPCRRALTASADFAMRQKLRKVNREPLPSSQLPTNWEDSEHYSTGVALYQSLGKKASGKPALRLEPSLVGSLIISR